MGQRLDASSHRHRVAAQGSSLIDRPLWCQYLHNVCPSAKGGSRETASDDLADGGHIGRDAVALLGTAAGKAEAGDYLVEDQHGTVLLGDFTGGLQEFLSGHHHTHIAGDRLQNKCRHPVAVSSEVGAKCFHIVIG